MDAAAMVLRYGFVGSLPTAFAAGALGGLFGSASVSVAANPMPVSMGFAASAMLFIISDEINPETHRSGFENVATFSLMGGFARMTYPDAVLGQPANR